MKFFILLFGLPFTFVTYCLASRHHQLSKTNAKTSKQALDPFTHWYVPLLDLIDTTRPDLKYRTLTIRALHAEYMAVTMSDILAVGKLITTSNDDGMVCPHVKQQLDSLENDLYRTSCACALQTNTTVKKRRLCMMRWSVQYENDVCYFLTQATMLASQSASKGLQILRKEFDDEEFCESCCPSLQDVQKEDSFLERAVVNRIEQAFEYILGNAMNTMIAREKVLLDCEYRKNVALLGVLKLTDLVSLGANIDNEDLVPTITRLMIAGFKKLSRAVDFVHVKLLRLPPLDSMHLIRGIPGAVVKHFRVLKPGVNTTRSNTFLDFKATLSPYSPSLKWRMKRSEPDFYANVQWDLLFSVLSKQHFSGSNHILVAFANYMIDIQEAVGKMSSLALLPTGHPVNQTYALAIAIAVEAMLMSLDCFGDYNSSSSGGAHETMKGRQFIGNVITLLNLQLSLAIKWNRLPVNVLIEVEEEEKTLSPMTLDQLAVREFKRLIVAGDLLAEDGIIFLQPVFDKMFSGFVTVAGALKPWLPDTSQLISGFVQSMYDRYRRMAD